MRLAAFGFLAALLAAPLAAQAAQPAARFAVTLQGTVVDRVTYERIVRGEECTSNRTGQGGRSLAIRSLRPTTVEVSAGSSGVVYRPARVLALRVAATTLPGMYSELRVCRFLPPEKLTGKCNRASGSVRRVAAAFRRGRNAIVFRAPARSAADVLACGLDRQQATLGGWLNLVSGRIDQDALLDGRSRRVVARATGTRERKIGGNPAFTGTRKTTIRWSLTFRRLS
jgi:hypothetical protein